MALAGQGAAPVEAPVPARVTGLILAGGAARRMGGCDKGLVELQGQALVAWVLRGLAGQCAEVWISANRQLDRYAVFGCPVIADRPPAARGPLAGIATALDAIRTPWLLTVPCDAPLVPVALGARLATAVQARRARAAFASADDRAQPLHALIARAAAADLHDYLAGGGRSVLGWMERLVAVPVTFAAAEADFSNLNSRDDLAALSARLAGATGTPPARRRCGAMLATNARLHPRQ